MMSLFFISPQTADASGPDPVLVDDTYRIKIISSQWKFVAIDLNSPDCVNLLSSDCHEYSHSMGSFEFGKFIEFELVSKDVQHGFSINELNIAAAANRLESGQDESTPVKIPKAGEDPIKLPEKDVTLSAFCHIFCGLGHPDMKMKFVVGAGSKNWGPSVFYTIIALNVLIFGFVIRSIVIKIRSVDAVTA
jgi:heme/copper-type cytochrome/quinol oxidase subunit 2